MNAPELFKNLEALGVVTPDTAVKVGETYLVMVAKERERWHDQLIDVPIAPFLHSDPQFGADILHYHIDGRFVQFGPLTNRRDFIRGRTFNIVVPGKYGIVGLDVAQIKCVRQQSGLMLQEIEVAQYQDWYDSKVGSKCNGKRCPHYGVKMVQRKGGLLECPLHGLFADKKTQRIIPRSEALARIKPKI